MVINKVTNIKNILKVNRKTPISMKWKIKIRKMKSQKVKMKLWEGTELNEIHDINVSLETNIGSLSENMTNIKYQEDVKSRL